MATEFGKRLKEARTSARLTQVQAAKKTGIPQSTISTAERMGESSTDTTVYALAYSVNAHWLATGEGSMKDVNTSQKASPISYDNLSIVQPTGRPIPVISWVQAGMWSEIQDNFHPGEADEWVNPEHTKPKSRSYALRVDGDSMTNPIPGAQSFPIGTILIVDPDAESLPGHFVIAKDVTTQKATFKRLMHDGGRWFLRPLNPAYDTQEIDDPAIRIIGRVVEFRHPGGKL